MSQPLARPRLADVVYRLYDRPLHPELFTALATRRVNRDGFHLTVQITPTGHTLEWCRGDTHLLEVLATQDQELPEAGRQLAFRFAGASRGKCRIGTAINYQVNLQAEFLAPEVFLHVHEELAHDGPRRGLVFHFRPHNRLGLTPLGLVSVETIPTGLAIACFHTFPEEFAIIRTQSLIEPIPAD
ncbi:MAG: DUF2617 family protein [Bacteroidales bacterium]|nr:DUF2617 family protein [Bacteroidales bacterium]